jgi:hypothetical protein
MVWRVAGASKNDPTHIEAPVIQMPMTDGQGNFATYAKDPEDPSRFLFQGFAQ